MSRCDVVDTHLQDLGKEPMASSQPRGLLLELLMLLRCWSHCDSGALGSLGFFLSLGTSVLEGLIGEKVG